ncbi:MAG TPA: glycosyltransferase family A protein [Sphingobium sp.]|uniref:glycosyltransferase n=1 Tax=Sphingobium sp. TaxID=1912891 RepID=UPI002ED5A9C5
MMDISIGIKALNEEANIAACLESALAAIGPFEGEVILADSGSTDRTIAIARQYPVRIIQLSRPEDRGCGAGAQLAYQFARGRYFYLLDGDMMLDPDFVTRGIAYLEAHPDVAGVGGWVTEKNTAGPEFQVRADKAAEKVEAFEGFVDHLHCGGLYRTDAIRAVGHFADRNLHAFEEFELGARLVAGGWKLARLDCAGVDHYGHTVDGYRLLWRRLRSGYSGGLGEVVRAAWLKPHFSGVLGRLRPLQMTMVVLCWWLALVACLVMGAFVTLLALLVLPLGYLTWRRKSFRLGLYSFTVCNMLTLGLLSGLVRGRVSPGEPLAARELA